MNLEVVGILAEVVSAVAVVVSLVYLARQVRMSNSLARAEAYRVPSSDLNALNATFATDPVFRAAFARATQGATRDEFGADERVVLDGYLISVANIYEQLAREVREGILNSEKVGFGAQGLFLLPYFRTSWSYYRENLSPTFVDEIEKSRFMDRSEAGERRTE